jgi:hypothetical protein
VSTPGSGNDYVKFQLQRESTTRPSGSYISDSTNFFLLDITYGHTVTLSGVQIVIQTLKYQRDIKIKSSEQQQTLRGAYLTQCYVQTYRYQQLEKKLQNSPSSNYRDNITTHPNELTSTLQEDEVEEEEEDEDEEEKPGGLERFKISNRFNDHIFVNITAQIYEHMIGEYSLGYHCERRVLNT